jgi:hypothetical protein
MITQEITLLTKMVRLWCQNRLKFRWKSKLRACFSQRVKKVNQSLYHQNQDRQPKLVRGIHLKKKVNFDRYKKESNDLHRLNLENVYFITHLNHSHYFFCGSFNAELSFDPLKTSNFSFPLFNPLTMIS